MFYISFLLIIIYIYGGEERYHSSVVSNQVAVVKLDMKAVWYATIQVHACIYSMRISGTSSSRGLRTL